jgi:tetratricopeptide (TPR) repeat protein
MDRGVRRVPRRALVGALTFFAAVTFGQAVAPPVAAAVQSDLGYISASTWTADAFEGRVHVVTVVTATSNTVDVAGRRFYYDHIQLTLPSFSTGYQALSVFNKTLPVTVDSVGAAGVTVTIGLGERLYSGASTTFSLHFDLVDSGGSTDRDFRIGHKVMSFPVSALGSPGTPGSTVTVIFPPAFTVQEELGNLTRAVYGSGEVVFSSGTIEDSTQFGAWFTAVQPVPASDFRVRQVVIGPLTISLRYWYDDVGWADQVESVLRLGYPLLRNMIGLGDPVSTTLTVEEASSADLGFSGSYDVAQGQVRISYFADPYVILHETAHMWFNVNLVKDRWVEEGFASYYAQLAVDQLGLPDHAPVLSDRILQSAVPLNDWIAAGQPNTTTEVYLYAAALEAAREIATLAGPDALRMVWAEARAGKAAYQPVHAIQNDMAIGQPTDWRRLLDLLDRTTGKSFAGIWQQWVLDPSQVPSLGQRTAALTDYSAALAAAGPWDLPPEVRGALGEWQFEQAASYMTEARVVLAERDEIATSAATEQTIPPPTLRQKFERSGLIAASSEASTELAALGALAAARQARTDNVGAARVVGLIGTDPQADLALARDAFARGDLPGAISLATSARQAWQGADDTGQMRIFGSVCVLVGLLILIGLVVWRRRSAQGLIAGASDAGSANSAAGAAAGSAAVGAPGVAIAAAGAEGRATAGGVGVGEGPAVRVRAGWRARAPLAAAITRHPLSAQGFRDDGSPEEEYPGDAVPGNGHDSGHLDGNYRGHGDAQGNGGAEPEGTGDSAADPSDLQVALPDWPVESLGWTSDASESAYDLLVRGTELLRDRHNAQAAVVLERASRLEQGKGSILEALGRAYFNSGQHARAAETFEALLEVDPSAHYGHFALGMSFARLGRAQEAKTHLRLAVALQPTSETYRRALDRLLATDP